VLRTQDNVQNAIVFANRKTTVALLEKSLRRHGFNAGALHGDMDQSARMKTLASFRSNELTYLIASDVAARGLDIPAVSHIFNFDVPTHAEDYVHRIGRTGRAGRSGAAFTLVTREEGKYLKAIEGLLGKDIPWFDAGGETVEEEPEAANENRRGSRERKPRAPARPRAEAAKPKAEAARPEPRRAPKPAATARPAAQPSHGPKPARDRHPQRDVSDAPDAHSFHEGNMPAFLMRSVKAAG
jgi:superfamily II DNA/RNA helicase